MAVELPEHAPNRGTQIWWWFVNVSHPQWVNGRLFPPNVRTTTWNPKHYILHVGTSVSTGKVFSLPKYFCWAHVLSTWIMKLFASHWSLVKIHKRGRRTHTLFSSCSEAQPLRTLILFFLPPLPARMTRARERSFAFPREPCNWSMPLGDRRPDFKALHCSIFTTFQVSARIFWARSLLNPSCAIFHTLHKMIKYTLDQGLVFRACFTRVLQSLGRVPLWLSLFVSFSFLLY